MSSQRDIKKWAKKNGYIVKDCEHLSSEKYTMLFAITVIDQQHGNELTGKATLTSTFPMKNVHVTWDESAE